MLEAEDATAKIVLNHLRELKPGIRWSVMRDCLRNQLRIRGVRFSEFAQECWVCCHAFEEMLDRPNREHSFMTAVAFRAAGHREPEGIDDQMSGTPTLNANGKAALAQIVDQMFPPPKHDEAA